MQLQQLVLEDFRRFHQQKYDFSPKTVLIGANGSGKSTVIEAIRLLSVGKSFRTSRLDELVSFEKPYLRLSAALSDPSTAIQYFYGLPFREESTKERQLKVNDSPVNYLDWLGRFPSVLFVPTDLDIVQGAPGERRRYLDGILWQVNKEFRIWQIELHRVLKERSALLFLLKIGRSQDIELSPWNELLERLTQNIRNARIQLIEYLNKEVKRITDKETFNLAYVVAHQEIEAVRNQEIKLAQNLYGPHRDEIDFIFKGRMARQYASRGQARTFLVVCKLAEVTYLKERLDVSPIILLDDILSELDTTNAQLLLKNLPNDSQQIVTSITEQALFQEWKELRL